MRIILTSDASAMGMWVAEHAAEDLRRAIEAKGRARLVVASGASQFEVLDNLVGQPNVDWSVIEGFHLDEYIGLTESHAASFCRYLRERFVSRVPLAEFHFLRGDADVDETIRRVGDHLTGADVDVALVGIGENGHLAFNDPPADFETERPYIVVPLDQACRRQQVGEGWFKTLDDVPTHAISMSIRQILRSKHVYCSVPDARKATALRNTLEGPITPDVPASILRSHVATTLVMDQAAASELSRKTMSTVERAE